MRISVRPFAAAALIAAWHLAAPTASAQAQSPSPAPSESSSKIPDQKLDAAAAAVGRVTDLRQSFQQQLDAAAPSDKERIAGEARNALVKAVTDQGLSVEEYTSILKVAQDDPAVRDKLLQRLKTPAR